MNSRSDSKKVSEIWENRVHLVRKWVELLKREHESPDLWQLLLNENKVYRIASAPQLGNEPFSRADKDHIIGQLNQMKRELASVHHLQTQQQEIVGQGFAYLAESLDRFGKKDWLNFAMGTLMSIAIAATFAPDVTRDMFHRFTAAVQPLFDSIIKLLG